MSAFGTWAGLTALGAAALPALRELGRTPMGRQARRNAPGQFVRLSDGITHYEWLGRGKGPVAVCVHGLTTPSFVWLGLVRELENSGFRVLTYDLFGRGYSDRPRDLQTPGFFTRQLRELLEDQQVHDDITLIGYSMGGVIAAAFAADHDHRLRRLVLLAPAGMGHELGGLARWAVEWPVIGDWSFHMGYPRAHRAATEADRGLPSSVVDITDLQLAELDRRGFVRSVLSSLRGTLRRPQEDVHRRIMEARLPVAAIWRREDRVIPIAAMGTLTQWNRDACHVVIDGAGHGLTYTHAAQVAQAILDTWEGPVVR